MRANVSGAFSIGTQLRHFWSPAGRWIDSFQGQVALGVGCAIIYTLAYLGHPALPGNNDASPAGWLGWWDQSVYWRSAAAVATGDLSAATYKYPIGYPIFGAITWHAAPRHAFFIPNLLLTVGIALLFYRLVRRFLSSHEALLFIVVFVFFNRGTLSAGLVEPWSTIPTHFFAYVLAVLLVFSRLTTRRIVLGAICIGLTYSCRPAEAACLLPILGAAILCLPTWRRRIIAGFGASGIILAFLVAIALLNYKIFGSVTSPYDAAAAGVFGAFPLEWKLYSLFVDGDLFFRESEPMLLVHYPWFLFCIPGAAIMVYRFGLRGFGALCSIVATYLLYLEFNDFWPRNVYRFHVIHYLVWTLPLIALFAYLGLRDGWRTPGIRWTLLSIPALGAFLLCYSLVEVPLEHLDASSGGRVEILSTIGRRPDWLAFIGASQLPPKLMSGDRELRAYIDYVSRIDGTAVLLAPHVEMPITVNDATLTAVETGQLRSRFALPTRIPDLSIMTRPASPRTYKLGRTINFGTSGDSARFRVRGWSHTERQLTWIEGSSAVLVLGIPASQPLALRVTMAGLVKSPDLPSQTVEVFANGKKIADWQVAEKKEYIAHIPGSITAGGELMLEFQTPNATTPKSLGINDDSRILSACMFSLTIEKSGESK